MAITSIKIMNVMVFQRQWRKNNNDIQNENNHISDAFEVNFSDGINVLIGENGIGKTTLLKMIYAASQWSNEHTDVGKTNQFIRFFSNGLKDSDMLINSDSPKDYSFFEVSDGKHTFTYSLSHKGILNFGEWLGLNIQSVYIPTTEMLSHSKGFLALNQKYHNMPFDGTQVDIIVNASLPEVREIPLRMQGILDKISQVIDGTVIQEDDIFYVLKKDGRKVDFSLEAEGLRKLGLLWKLIRNGLIEKDTILLWDEPEANLNPELFPLVAEILLELQKNGVQIFVATHSYNFAKYLEILRNEEEQVQFHNIYKRISDVYDEGKDSLKDIQRSGTVCCSSAYTLEKLGSNHIMAADIELLDRIYDL